MNDLEVRPLQSQSLITKVCVNVLEEFDGFVDKFEGQIAHITLKSQTGEMLYGEYPVNELKAHGVQEHRRFKCRTLEIGAHVEIAIESIPDQLLTPEDEQKLDAWLLKSLGTDDAPQNDY